MSDDRYRIFAELTKDAADAEKAVILELLKTENPTFCASSTFLMLNQFLTAYAVSIAIFFIEMILIGFSPRGRLKSPLKQLFCASAESNTTNLHLQRLANVAESRLDVLVLESPMKRFDRKLADVANIRTIWCRTLWTDLNALRSYLGVFLLLWSAVDRSSRHRKVESKALSMILVRLLRGMSISQFLARNGVSRIIFTLSGNASSSIIELRMKGAAKTVHWLHGVGLGFNFDSFSDETLVNNEFDQTFYSDRLSGNAVFFPDNTRRFSVPRSVEAIRTVVLYSNLIHPGSKHYKEIGIEVERELLSIVFRQFRGRVLVLKPHPTTIDLLGGRIDDYKVFLKEHGFRIEENTRDYAPEDTLYISTVSTSYVDLVAAGKCVFLYDKFANRHSDFQNHVSPEIRFKDEASFGKALDLFENTERLIAELSRFRVQSEARVFEYLLS